MKRYAALLLCALLCGCSSVGESSAVSETTDITEEKTAAVKDISAEEHDDSLQAAMTVTFAVTEEPAVTELTSLPHFPEDTQVQSVASGEDYYYETWPGVPEDNWGINPFRKVEVTVTEQTAEETPTEEQYFAEQDGYIFNLKNGHCLFIPDNDVPYYMTMEKCFESGDYIYLAYIPKGTEEYPSWCTPLNADLIDHACDKPLSERAASVLEETAADVDWDNSDVKELSDGFMHLTGYYFNCENGMKLFITDTGDPIILKCGFEFENGQRVRIDTLAIEESYPYGCYPEGGESLPAEDGPMPRLITDKLSEMAEMGYVAEQQ